MSDLISRQALCEYALNQKNKSVTPNDIMRFPSAQSTQTNAESTQVLISRQAAIDVVKWGESVRTVRDEIKKLPGVNVWKPASVKPERYGTYLAACGKYSGWWYALLYYGEYEEYGESETVKHGWYRIDDDSNYIDYDDGVRYWTELPDMPEVEE